MLRAETRSFRTKRACSGGKRLGLLGNEFAPIENEYFVDPDGLEPFGARFFAGNPAGLLDGRLVPVGPGFASRPSRCPWPGSSPFAAPAGASSIRRHRRPRGRPGRGAGRSVV